MLNAITGAVGTSGDDDGGFSPKAPDYFAAASPFLQTRPEQQAKRSPTVLLRQVLPDDLNHAVGSRTRWEKP